MPSSQFTSRTVTSVPRQLTTTALCMSLTCVTDISSLPLFAAAIVAGNLARLPTATLNKAAAIYLASRLTFNGLYIYGTNSECCS